MNQASKQSKSTLADETLTLSHLLLPRTYPTSVLPFPTYIYCTFTYLHQSYLYLLTSVLPLPSYFCFTFSYLHLSYLYLRTSIVPLPTYINLTFTYLKLLYLFLPTLKHSKTLLHTVSLLTYFSHLPTIHIIMIIILLFFLACIHNLFPLSPYQTFCSKPIWDIWKRARYKFVQSSRRRHYCFSHTKSDELTLSFSLSFKHIYSFFLSLSLSLSFKHIYSFAFFITRLLSLSLNAFSVTH